MSKRRRMKCWVCKREDCDHFYFFEEDPKRRYLCVDCVQKIAEMVGAEINRQILEGDDDVS